MNAAALPAAIDAIARLIERGDFPGAQRHALATLQTLPAHAEIWRLLAIAQMQSGNLDAAAHSLEQAHALDATSIDVLCNLATLETRRGAVDTALVWLQRALALDPNHVPALTQLGRLHHQSGEFAQALAYFERGAQVSPQRSEAWFHLANAEMALQRWDTAQTHVRRGLDLAPESAEGWYLLAFLNAQRGRFADAAAAYRRSLQLRPSPQSAHNLALVLDQLGDQRGSLEMLEYAVRLDPGMAEALSQLVYTRRQLCLWEGLPDLSRRLLQAVDAGAPGIGPFAVLAEDSTPTQQRHAARTFAQHLARSVPVATRTYSTAPTTQPLRVGFVSSGFNQHATGLLVVELIERLRDSPIAAVAFATTPGDGSAWRRRLESAFSEFHAVTGQSAETIAARVRAANIEILIDLDGYCLHSMPRIFALRPAPVQVNFLAYPGSLGAPWYDYLIADPHVIPAHQRAFYDERVALLPRCYQPTDSTRRLAPPPTRGALGLPDTGIVYCCFNAAWKITPAGFARWMRILAAVPNSTLWLLEERADNGVSARLRDHARQAGIDPQRLVFAVKAEHAAYLAQYQLADLFLDTHPYNAHTTASDALFAGCPVLTRSGETFAARVATSLNRTLGLDALVVADDDAYVARAIELGQQPEQLAALRAQLRDPARRTRLFDMRQYADDFAALLTAMATRARAGQPAQDISL